jgi:hypothetical protein
LAALLVGVSALALQGCTPAADTTASDKSQPATLVAGTGLSTGPTAAPDATATSRSCTPLPLIASTYIAADGSTLGPNATDADRRAAANKRVYRLPDGMTTSMIIPPVGFNPATASPATAKAFGFDDQEKNYSGYRGTIASVPCASHFVHGAAH